MTLPAQQTVSTTAKPDIVVIMVDDLDYNLAMGLIEGDANGSHLPLEDTVLIFTSDNGYFHGEHRLSRKVIPYEEALRIPLMMRVPGISGGQVITQPVLMNDLAPTILELADVSPPASWEFDGRSLVPLL